MHKVTVNTDCLPTVSMIGMPKNSYGKIVGGEAKEYHGRVVTKSFSDHVYCLDNPETVWKAPLPSSILVYVYPKGTKITIEIV